MKNMAEDLKLEERVEQHSQHQWFITLTLFRMGCSLKSVTFILT